MEVSKYSKEKIEIGSLKVVTVICNSYILFVYCYICKTYINNLICQYDIDVMFYNEKIF